MTIREGKNRQIRKMCALCGLEVRRLKRIREASIDQLEVTIGSGKDKTPLKAGEDFTIVGYSNNIKTGNAALTIRGTGKYGGTKTVKFKILPKWMQRK